MNATGSKAPLIAPYRQSIGEALAALALVFSLTTVVAVAAPTPKIIFVELSLNEHRTGIVTTAYASDVVFLVPRADIEGLRIRLDDVPSIDVQGEPYVNLHDVRGLEFNLDPVELVLQITCLSDCLHTTAISNGYARRLQPDPPDFGMFLNYAGAYQHQRRADDWTGAYELGAFDGFGAITTTGHLLDTEAQGSSSVRLDTSWTYDIPAKRIRARFGDAVTRPGAWGAALRYGGFKISTDFSLQPYFISFPTPDFAGDTALPSSIDVYVNNVRRLSTNVPAGPFELQQIPVITGSGDVVVVIRDSLGREQTLSAPYYSAPALLREGLVDYSFDAGLLRESYGLRSNDYGDGFGALTLRRGLSPRLTVEGRAEASRDIQVLGASGVGVVSGVGQLTATAAVSEGKDRSGSYGALGWETVSRRWNAALKLEGSTEGFTRLGGDVLAEAPRLGLLSRLGYGRSRWGRWTVGYTYRRFRADSRDFESLFASLGLPVSKRMSLTLIANEVLHPDSDTFIGLTLARSFGQWRTGTLSLSRQGGRETGQISYQQSAPLRGGLGYRLNAGIGDDDRRQSGMTWETQRFIANADVSDSDAGTATRLDMRGGVAWMANDLHFSRPLDDSFAVVETGGVPGVPVRLNNLEIGRTNQRGQLFIHRLRPYQLNALSIDANALPLTTRLGQTERSVVPRFRSGTRVRFDVNRKAGALLHLHHPDGKPVSAGARVTANGSALALPVAVNGRLYLEEYWPDMLLHIRDNGRSCQVSLPSRLPTNTLGNPLSLICEPAS